ncbi:polysaccharide deacetylase family protein [Dictyobacter aurantiacus]|uniref:NodB homology domain-containing protein n=1 Tax=Dictyobacter aurantiacus TaxID=1936993 RepID=A0A401ZA27_9CHLR|nr:polysaccharide deacetylase family protein [Dictyobacter aurantiacus]GCE03717.1 hypothetical protein KDAU_10460 [Dictyobacter aurantiacus]
MYERMRVVIAAMFYYLGITYLALRINERLDRRVIILNYHNANHGLPAHMRYLQRHYRIVHLEKALEELFGESASGTKKDVAGKRDHRRPLVLTFDDGYIDNYVEGFRLARLYQVPITIFLIPGYIDSGRYFWWLAASKLVSLLKSEQVTFDGRIYHLTMPHERQELIDLIDGRARYTRSIAEREQFLAELQLALQVALPCREITTNDTDLPMTWEQIREMEASGLVSFGAHTVNHPILAYLADPADVLYEVQTSRQILEEKLGHPVRMFAYPVGKMQHIGERGIEAVKAAGFTWAVTTLETLNTSESDPYLLGRMPGDTEVNWMVMAAELVGLLGIVSRIRKKYAKLFKK